MEKHVVIKYFSTNSDKKAAVVERFNKTLKTAMWKYFYSKGTYKCIDVLDELVDNYNGTKHSTILMKLKDVDKKKEPGMDHTVRIPFCRESATKIQGRLYGPHR